MLLVIQLLFIPMQKFSQSYIVFINVGQGDSVLINHKTVTLIDTGGSYSKDLATEVLIPFLKYEGVNKIDRLIITHNDFDHSGAANSLESNFNVVSRDEEYLLPLPNYGNENDDSKVYYRVINGIGILLLADISKDVERDLIRMYPDLKVDVVKIAHHGSSTSTSEEMIKEYRPQTAVLSYGRNNYGHPSSDVINVLAKYKVETYHTYLHGSIKINLNTKKISTSNVV